MALPWRRNYLRYRSFFMNIYRVYQTRSDIRMYMEILLSLVTIGFFAAFALRPTALTVTQLIQEIKTKEETIVQMDKKLSDLVVAQSLFRKEFDRIKLLNQAMPDVPSPESFTRQIEGLTSKNNTDLKNLILGDVALVGEPKKLSGAGEFIPLPEGAEGITFSLTAVGGYKELESLLKDLENLRRPLRVDYATLNTSQTDNVQTLSLSVTGRVPYFQKK